MKLFLLAFHHNPSSLAKRKEMAIQWLWCLFFILSSSSSSLLPVSATENSITTTNSISKNQTIVSAGGKFALGFFTPDNSTSSYLGIWYNTIPKLTVIWVANRASPIPKDSPAVLKISEDGNLAVLSGKEKIVWTSNVTVDRLTATSTVAVLLDNGNLELRSGEGGGQLWQSFDHPSDTYVAEMKISSNRKTGHEVRLTSWANDEDPSLGIFSSGIDPNGLQFYTWKGNEPYWRSNVYPVSFSYASPLNFGPGFSAYISWAVEEDEVYLVSSISSNSIRMRYTLAPSGRIELLAWMKTKWMVLWQGPLANCDFYSHCGPFTICQKNESTALCKCLTGFQPKSHNEWIVGNWTGGCVRSMRLGCDKGDGFLKFENMKLPDHAVSIGNGSVSDCEQKCFQNCSCTAYAYANVTDLKIVVCLNWFRELVDIVNNYGTGRDLYVRVHKSKMVDESQEHGFTDRRKHMITVAVAVTIISIGLLLISIFGYFRRRKRQIQQERIKSELLGFDSMSTASGDGHNNAELTSFSLKSVLAATGSFSAENKLGEGGFGPVYKGSLPGNREVAVKRLSTRSSQGRKEFMNELKLIAKLQHTNLVRLLGCCVEENEQILMYEYMPNRSLDQFLFDPSESANLDWSKRFKIIEGIAQGLLYLHKYSRLRVIHRDLKASNVLLDQMMTPKISDFGLARIFAMNQIEDKTNRVVGTYGYMAPEYALHGRFSERSDVFSFGVLLLEIVTGKRNTSLNPLTVSEWAWDNWMEGRALDLIDPSMRETYNPLQAVKCINVGLLCVQETMSERPTMSEVVIMLSNETTTIQSPKKPAFTIHEFHRSSQISSRCSNNEITMTNVEPR
ncbi:hypothetical protein OSB04_022557 [Centaurea solstitialis]|uniref:Receptor-like serine/threonine-protein kinase n=1 Tax=Centaurea solstitialis TaxID=347529 RepID=A0AA38SY04_9ASTR|nr:hypothetical protein OSB04_022557 [Centaurea solstitialis]